MHFKPHWENQHDWWIEDFEDIQDEKAIFADMLRKHPDDEMGNMFRDILKSVDIRLKDMKREYKKIYGINFNMNRLKER